MVDLLSGYDLIITQISDIHKTEALRIGRLREAALPVLYLPAIVFRGFHPDVIYLRNRSTGGILYGIGTQYQSAIVAAAFLLGLPHDRIEDLFNAYVFAELGYFDAFRAEKPAFLANLKAEGYDLEPVFDSIVEEIGSFMYTINHPHILLITIMCRMALAKHGLIDPETPLPVNIPDRLFRNFVCPVYPQIAKRIGVSGSTVFLKANKALAADETRELTLADYIASSYQIYERLPADTFRDPAVNNIRDRLKSIVD
jgi:hypothetical protein